MKLFVTGATGFIGRHFVKEALSSGYSITVNLLENEASIFGSEVSNYCLAAAAMPDAIAYFNQQRFDGIVHLASYVQSGAHKSTDIDLLLNANINFGVKLLEIGSETGVKWFINTGTYWQHYQEKSYSPVNLYAATKQAFEDIGRYYVENTNLKFYTIKLYDTFGPNDTRPKIFNLWDKIAKSGEVLDMSPGEQVIDVSFIDDIIAAYIQLTSLAQNADATIVNGESYYVTAEKRYTLKELANVFEEATNQKLNINWGGRPYRDREVMMPWKDGKVVPGWKPQVSITDGISRLNVETQNGG